MFGLFGPKKGDVLHHWHALAEGFQTSSDEFYASIQHQLEVRKIPGLTVSRVNFSEGGMLSSKREYLRLTRERLIFDICAAPFGTGYFFSSRYAQLPKVINPIEVLALLVGLCILLIVLIKYIGIITGFSLMFILVTFGPWMMRNAVALGLHDIDAFLLKIPVLGSVYEAGLRNETYYREDTRLMYLQTVPAVVKELAEEITGTKGIKLTKQFERAPLLGELYKPVAMTKPASQSPDAFDPRANNKAV